jgi:hypothetical protein
MCGYRGRPEVILRIFRVMLFEIWQDRHGAGSIAHSLFGGASPWTQRRSYRAVRMAGVDAAAAKSARQRYAKT